MADQLPYMPTFGLISRVLDKVKTAATPDRFTGDFLANKLGFKGGTPRPIVPFLKRVGFLATDGSPTDIYKSFRNPSQSGQAAARALKIGYRALYEMNEFAHDLSDVELKGLVVQATGAEPNSTIVRAVVGSFKALKAYAKFDEVVEKRADQDIPEDDGDDTERNDEKEIKSERLRLGMSYTINLNLPPTSDIAVFNAIFKSLKNHLLR